MTAIVIDQPAAPSGPPPARDAARAAQDRLGAGLPVLLVAGERTVLVVAAHSASTEVTALLVRHTSGFLAVALPRHRCAELDLPPLDPFDSRSSTMCVGVDAVGVGTGISAADRALTSRTLLDRNAIGSSFTRPGHLVPVSVSAEDLRIPATAAAAALALVRDAGLPQGALYADVVSIENPTATMSAREAAVLARRLDVPLVVRSLRTPSR